MTPDIWRFDNRVQTTVGAVQQRCSAAKETICFSRPAELFGTIYVTPRKPQGAEELKSH